MFTGIVEGTAVVISNDKRGDIWRLTLDLGTFAEDAKIGESVACAGVCLTVVHIDGTNIGFDMIQETVDRTNLGTCKPGDRINIERSMRFGDRVGGHVVSGHIMGTGALTDVVSKGESSVIRIALSESLKPYIFTKGFIALDGCSLTVVDVADSEFSIHLIPETMQITTFGTKQVGDLINIECDSTTVTIVDTIKNLYATQQLPGTSR